MASWMIHLRITDLLLDRIPGLDETAFVFGNIAPDSGVPNADWSVFTPSKSVSHYQDNLEDKTTINIDRFLREYFSPELIRSYSLREFSFFLGYYTHLLSDIEWAAEIAYPSLAAHPEKARKDRTAFIWEMKRDWYDLDFRYLLEHPDFRAFNIYEQAVGFKNDLMDTFSQDAFEHRREYIRGFYRGEHGELYREYPYLTPEQADGFVEETVEKVGSTIQPKLEVWNEEVPFNLENLQPSQFWISEKKLKDIRAWFNPDDLKNFDPIPVKMLDGIPIMTDGHTRAVAALLAGKSTVPLTWDRDDLGWDLYRECVKACKERSITKPQDLVNRILAEEEYHEKWDLWCDGMQMKRL